jgi:hypothetical protein
MEYVDAAWNVLGQDKKGVVATFYPATILHYATLV